MIIQILLEHLFARVNIIIYYKNIYFYIDNENNQRPNFGVLNFDISASSGMVSFGEANFKRVV